MVSWFWMIIISLGWMLLVYLTVLFLLLHDNKNKIGLGAIVLSFMAMIIPVIIFVFTNIMCRVNKVNETAYWVIMAVMSGVFIGGPILYGTGRILYRLIRYAPKRMAAYARKEVGSFHAFHKKRSIYRVHEDHHEAEQAYIEEQLRITREKLGALYHMRSRRGKERLIREIMDVNQKEIPGMKGWEYRTVLADNFEAKTDMLVSFHDGETILIYLHWPKKGFTPEELMEEDRTKLALAKQFRNITMTGRLIYIFMCIERYLVSMYPDRDWTPVASRMWNRTKEPERWSEGTPGDLFREIVPERIMRFYKHGYGYEELNSMVFDKQLSLEDYTRLRGLYEGISKGDSKEEINQLVGLPEKLIYMANLRDYAFGISNQMTIEAILKAERILMKNGIELPDYASVERFSYKRTSDEMPDKERSVFFGFGVDADELSILLNEAFPGGGYTE